LFLGLLDPEPLLFIGIRLRILSSTSKKLN
jgi:hypothetical protein